ncbi:MAG: rRNA maturation RNase YbeY [Saprospiraceae bacterium]|nr:rRNA maturation RNase YbeY [Saprospiraceae bacterium]
MPAQGKIGFNFQTEEFHLRKAGITKWLERVAESHGKKLPRIDYIFCKDDYLLELNRQFLQHDYFTDVVTFPGGSPGEVSECYISVDRVRENARTFNQEEDAELLRVIVHGLLHLLGYDDKQPEGKERMREAEDRALALYGQALMSSKHYFDWVYDVVRQIPRGRVCTYGAIADYLALGSARMVGWALNQLKGTVGEVPAHRVVNVRGELSGRMMFGEAGERMARLLREEGVCVEDQRVVPMEKYFWDPGELETA